MGLIIAESGMQFGPYENDDVFYIEKSSQYCKQLSKKGIKICEFIWRKNNRLYFVEAKTSCPRQITAVSSEEKRQKYETYVHDIVLKMRHSLTLYANILLERYSNEGLSEELLDTHMADIDIRLVLVVKNAEKEWLEPFADVFRKTLQEELSIWKIPTFSVINEETARKVGLIREV